jgi:ERO1-like protein alpha
MTIPPRDPKDVALNLTTQLSRKAIPWGLDDAKTGSWSADADRWGEHVDLILNPESNTYYLGEMANRIWRAIYDENCFKAATESEMCTEERLFYRLMSGLHASISVHLSANYYVNPHSVPPTYNWNLDEFQRRVGAHPDRIRNLYVTYLFVVRSVAKVKHLILSGNYNSGDLIEDAHLRREIQALLNSRLLCIDTFNESDVVQSDHSAEYVNQMHEKLLNITRLTDCLTCEKCRLWGKVQMLGLGTALRIVLSKEPIKSLQRGEVVTLINLLRQLSYSIARVGEMSTAFSSRQDIHSEKSDNL